MEYKMNEMKEFEVDIQMYQYIKAKDRDEAIRKFIEDNFSKSDEDEILRYISCYEVED